MNLKNLYNNKTIISFEVFPPKKTTSIENIYNTLHEMKDLSPDYISVTFGAGGSSNNNLTVDIASRIKNKYNIESVAHLPGMHLTKEDVLKLLDDFKEHNINNILALRGDPNPLVEVKNDFKYASDLVSFIKENGDFNIIAACYPEKHIEAKSIEEDIENLKIKVDAGTDQLITQLFLDNNDFYSFIDKTNKANIKVPIQAGIMPVTNKIQTERMVSMCGAKLPTKFVKVLDKYGDNPLAMRDAGIAYAIDQIVDLIAQGVDGIHLYTMNNAYIAKQIYGAVINML
ncbi:MAG TPA: methylenetetrahydrofolate reductase [NAD(P)H] [Clostridiales bacterium]|nr:methylenetetrahydrofolate reductase [NAD(P)H] [Clostridiales bacterium]